jgi:hypothetical protein
MAARAARNDNLKMPFFAHRSGLARTLLEAAETAPRRGGWFACSVFVHELRFTRASHFNLPKQR